MYRKFYLYIFTVIFNIYSLDALAIVSYDVGRMEINGVQLFQDSKNEMAYYYLPKSPSLSKTAEGDYEFLCIKYVGDKVNESGGLLHALINYNLDQKELEEIQKILKERIPGAQLMGPILVQEDKDNSKPSFRIISSILNNSSDSILRSQLITSGKAPFLQGSKVAISSILSTKAATLLWSTFESNTSDVSVVVEGYFPALVTGFSATVNANLETVYNHFSSNKLLENSASNISDKRIEEFRRGYDKSQITTVVDSLAKAGLIEINIMDAGKSYNVETTLYKNLLDIITNKILALMFESEDGWRQGDKATTTKESNTDNISKPLAYGQLYNYRPENILQLKAKESIQSFAFSLIINQSTAIKVPVYSAGNLGGFYKSNSVDENYFKVVDMEDPVFQSRDLHFQINSSHSDCFKNGFENATILIKKFYKDSTSNSYSQTLRFNASSLESGALIKSCKYNRLSEKDNDWLIYHYKVAWHLDGIDTTLTTDWIETDMSSVSIQPPLERRNIIIDLDRGLMKELGVQSARIRFGIKVLGQAKMTRMLVLRKTDPMSTNDMVLYIDEDQPIVYQVSWYAKGQEIKEELKLLDDDYLFLIPQEIQE